MAIIICAHAQGQAHLWGGGRDVSLVGAFLYSGLLGMSLNVSAFLEPRTFTSLNTDIVHLCLSP